MTNQNTNESGPGLRRLPNGRWLAWYRDDDRKQHQARFDNKTDARDWRDEQRRKVKRGGHAAPKLGRVTVGEFGRKYLDEYCPDIKPKTRASYESMWRSRVEPRWSSTPLANVKPSSVNAWMSTLRSAGLSASRTRQCVHLLGAILKAAQADHMIATNPVGSDEVKKKLPKLIRGERRYLDVAELERLAVACGDYELLVLVLGYCGLRYGEAAALRVRRFDPMRRRLEIAEAVTSISGTAVFGTPKTHQVRSVPVPPFLVDRLVEHVHGRKRDEFVFAAPQGGVLTVNAFRDRYFDAACTAVDLAEFVIDDDGRKHYSGLTPHDLRHTAASLAIASGANVKGVQRMLGHKSAAMTLDTYADLFDDQLDDVADRMGKHRADVISNSNAGETRTTDVAPVVALRREAV